MKFSWLLPFAACGLLLGCGNEEHDDIKQWMNEEAKNMRGKVEEPPPLFSPPIVSYAARDLESPFSPEKVRSKENSPTDRSNPAVGHTPEYLESFPLEALKLIGVIYYEGKPFALIQTPEKPKHVTVGNYIGQSYGRISEITKSQITVTETVKDSNDAWVKRDKTLYLQVDGDKK